MSEEKIIIKAKINVSLIEKDKMFRGKNGVYLDITLIETPVSKYGDDFMIVQDPTKEERAAGKKGTILGNAKYRRRNNQQQQQASGEYGSNPPGRQSGGDVAY